jgi:hypothetical protein
VLCAKVTAAVVLGVIVVMSLSVLALVGTAVAGAVAGTDPSYDNALRHVAGSAIAMA